ncbi:unnamed protein product [Kuraishia capsulata CBS 1993]|uniref:polynucleotide adenylyltransferase n=1 Tax=Kuraishia capsulata CBS 1993 TaxID=1382522 RepID=W6MHU6_9ASCO|nr:uncharacterized protein KUCA_T00001890001 [Kuraishia capsulata CBS 1993]CDK25919.1 unnamed protein product [Kuraishia capsulata CBS 1993]
MKSKKGSVPPKTKSGIIGAATSKIKKITKGLKKKNKKSKAKESTITRNVNNNFQVLQEIDDIIPLVSDNSSDESESSRKGSSSGQDIILADVDSESEETTPKNKEVTENSLAGNDDFIAFGFSSDEANEDGNEDEEEEGNASENEYLSNDETFYHTKSTDYREGDTHSLFPWIKNNDHSKEVEVADWLTQEIKDFIHYISPSVEEIEARNYTVQRLREEITQLWPDSEVHVFGSSATDLYLPSSDIDMVVVSPTQRYEKKSYIYQLSALLRNKKMAINVETITGAKVPIIKFVDPLTKIHIDISFERVNGIKAAETIIEWLKDTPGLRELVLVVKQFLSVRKLNVVHGGGLGGFSTICLVYSFLKLHPRVATKSIDPTENLGVLLIEFFELYGYNFGYDSVVIGFNDYGPCYITKSSNDCFQNRNPFMLAVQDPNDPDNNVSRGTFNIRNIKRAFGGAFELLANKCYVTAQASYKERLGESILGGIIRYKGKERDFEDARGQVVNEAFAVASGAELTRTVSLPPLPSEVRRAKAAQVPAPSPPIYYSDMTSSEDSGLEEAEIETIISKNNFTQKKRPAAEELMGLANDEEEDSYSPKLDASNTTVDSVDSSLKNINKQSKREFWLKKSGSEF